MRTTNKQLRGDDQPDLDTMRYDLAEREAMNMGVSEVIEILLNGCEGLEDMPEIEVRDALEEIFRKDVDNSK